MNVKTYKVVENPKSIKDLVKSGGTTVIETGSTIGLREDLYLEFINDLQGEWSFFEYEEGYILVESEGGNHPKLVVHTKGTNTPKLVGLVFGK